MMKTPARKIGITLLLLGLAQSASAVPTTILDGYIGGDDHGYGDVIGNTGDFGISSMDVDISGNILTVSINTGFAGKGDNGLFAGYTTNNTGIGYGDLFLSSSWNPAGASPYVNDSNTNGTVWSYGFSLDNRWMSETENGTGTLYSLNSGNNDADALLSEDFLTGATYRNGQEIAVDLQGGDITKVSEGSWNISSGQVNFMIDLTGTALASSKTIALHWGMTCGNDVIEGQYTRSVPAPGILSLMLTGFILTILARRKSIL